MIEGTYEKAAYTPYTEQSKLTKCFDLGDDIYGTEESLLHCPSCKGQYTHYKQTIEHNNTKDNRLCVSLLFECEFCKCDFFVNFRQHKGNTFASASFVVEKDKD